MTLTPDERRRYRDEGYLVFPRLIRGESLARYRQMLNALVDRAVTMSESRDGFELQPDEEGNVIPGHLHKVQGICVVEPRLLALAREPEIVGRVVSLLGSPLHMFASKFLPMLPHGGTSTGWHQDNFYLETTSTRVLTCGIYLEASDRANGCLRLVPGSHLAGGIRDHRLGQARFSHGSWTEVDGSEAVDIECPGGTVVFFSANLLHGAGTNHSVRTRYSTAWQYIPAEMELGRFRYGAYEDRHVV